jgi:hypothetical protein
MKKLLSLTLGLLVLGALAVGSATAATIAPGPYYATPSWDQTLPAATRFIVLTNMSSQAVLDRETGLVWEQAPDAPTTYTWSDVQASFHCNRSTVGGRQGWRLPTIQELASLIDPTVPSPGPMLPAGHPFTNVQDAGYWSATTFASNTSLARIVPLSNGHAVGVDKTASLFVWCVRGGQGGDPQ